MGTAEMNNERTGERVFGNVDEALAERIVSRAKKNSGEPESVYDGGRRGKPLRRREVSIIKIVIPAVLILVAFWICVKSKSLKSGN